MRGRRRERHVRGVQAAAAAMKAAALAAAATLSGAGSAQAQTDQDCRSPQESCGGLLSRSCLSSLGAGVIAVGEAGDCQAQMTQYRECLASVAETCQGPETQQEPNAPADALEELAKLGGLIETPETAVEFYNNALVYARRGDLLSGRRMLERAIAAGATQIDVYQRYSELLKAQEGLIGAREILKDLARRQPDAPAAAWAAAAIAPAPEREAALRALVESDAPFGPAWRSIADLYAASRVGAQSLTDQRAEKAALEAFQEADASGGVYRWFLEKDVVEAWREDARRRLAAYQNRNLDAAPVSMTARASNDSWMVTLQILETARTIKYRVDGGEIRDTGLLSALNPQTGEPMPRPFLTLPLGVAAAEIEVWYVNIRGVEEGPFTLRFSADAAFVASAKEVLGSLTQNWVQGNAWDTGYLVYFTHLMSYRCGLEKVEYGVGVDTPDQVFDMGPCDPRNPYAIPSDREVYLTFERVIPFMTVRLTYGDGSASEVRRFEFSP